MTREELKHTRTHKMNDELENQIPAQDCELEYWLQQAENYAAVQIPADDLRAIIARIYAAVNALPELLAENERLREALQAIADRHIPDQPAAYDVPRVDYIAVQYSALRMLARAALKETDQ